jgi:hypothetical protein
MRVEFRQGVPKGCIEWLWNNVGPGNIEPRGDCGKAFAACWGDAWLYERVEQEIPSTDPSMDSNVQYVPTITVKDPKLATLFVLRWS